MNEPELDRREKILRIAAKFFLNKGYSATSVDEIAEAAGTTGPALYRFFDSKQDILHKICLVGMEMRMKGVQAAIDKGYSDPRDTLNDLVKTRIDFALGPWGYQVPLTLAEYKHLSSATARKIDTASELGTAEWFRCLSQIRPKASSKELLTVIYAVLMEITYVALHLEDLDLGEDIRPYLLHSAMVGLTSEY